MKMKNKDPEPAIPNAHYEALLRMRANNPGAWRVLSPNTKLAVEWYLAAKREKARLEETRQEQDLTPAA
jgi:hypothetical protein